MSLFEDNNDFVQQTISFNANGTPILKTITLVREDGSNTNIRELIEETRKILQDDTNKDSIEKVDHLGTAILGPYASIGFKIAWIMRAIIKKYEQTNNTKLSIHVESTELTKEDLKKYTIDNLNKIIKVLEEKDCDIVRGIVDPTNDLGI